MGQRLSLWGNYWSDYTGKDRDGDDIGDTPYVIDGNNQDRYPLMRSWGEEEVPSPPFWMQWWFWAIAVIGIVALAGAAYFLKKRKPPTPTAPTLPTEGTAMNVHYAYRCHSHLHTKITQNNNPLNSYLPSFFLIVNVQD